jgi:hypothetical protein
MRSYSPSAPPSTFRRASGIGRSSSQATGKGSRVVSGQGIGVLFGASPAGRQTSLNVKSKFFAFTQPAMRTAYTERPCPDAKAPVDRTAAARTFTVITENRRNSTVHQRF